MAQLVEHTLSKRKVLSSILSKGILSVYLPDIMKAGLLFRKLNVIQGGLPISKIIFVFLRIHMFNIHNIASKVHKYILHAS